MVLSGYESLIHIVCCSSRLVYESSAISRFSADLVMELLYEDEDQILPLLLHRVQPGEPSCSCRDCEGILRRMRDLHLDVSTQAPPLVA